MEDDETCHVNSRHHQSVKQIAKGFEVTATESPDGVIEAMEKPDAKYCVAVQWHPRISGARRVPRALRRPGPGR
jgi:putative glutamine amidotransferase